MSEKIRLVATFPASAKEIYDAWLNGRGHSKLTGAKATASSKVNGKFTAWDGYITGKNLGLEDGKRIVQSWRTSEFPEDAPDSTLEITLEKKPANKTTLTLVHTNIPSGDKQKYTDGWKEFYFEPMKEYFASK